MNDALYTIQMPIVKRSSPTRCRVCDWFESQPNNASHIKKWFLLLLCQLYKGRTIKHNFPLLLFAFTSILSEVKLIFVTVSKPLEITQYNTVPTAS